MNAKKILKENFLPVEANRYAKSIYYSLLVNNAISRVAAGASTRTIDPTLPATWEFSGFSQNGEDGIIDYLVSKIKRPTKYFIEIGSSNGLENNTAYLAHVKKYAGIQIEGNEELHDEAILIKPWLVELLNIFVDDNNAEKILQAALFLNPDVFSIDIDGIDYYVTKLLLEKGLRPAVIVVEYNSAFGPERSVSVPYEARFNMFHTKFPYLYYGVSVNGWKTLLSKYNYQFVTVESNGTNAFFVDTAAFEDGFASSLQGVSFRENLHQFRLFKNDWRGQYDIIKDTPLYDI